MINRENILPLAGMFQAGYLIHEIAHKGNCDSAAFDALIKSILITDAQSTEEVYGGRENLSLGIGLLATMFNKENKARDMEIARYVLGIVHLEKKLRKNKALDEKLSAGVERAQNQAEVFEPTHENVIANLADVYAETISTIQPKIMVSGEPNLLTDTAIANKIRALLLALMRSTILWLQKGGSRWHLIFQRNKIIDTAKLL